MTNDLQSVLFGVLVCVFLGAGVYAALLLRGKKERDWKQIVADLEPLHFEAISLIAQDYLNPRQGQIELETTEIWQLAGGAEGLRIMRKNAEIMLELAAYAQRWNFEEGFVVSERMRRDAVALRRAVRRVELGILPVQLLKRLRYTVPFHVQEAASSYYLMRQRLLALYQTSHAGLYPALVETL